MDIKFSRYLFVILVSVFGVSCAHKTIAPNGTNPSAAAVETMEDNTIKNLPGAQPQAASSEIGQIPLEVNTEVEQWIRYFQGRGRGYFERYLERSTKYTPIMKKVLRENGVPEDLIYICMIESGFTAKIKSRAKAVGFWQFIKGTGNHYGLKNNNLMDERYDPVRSTEAAAAYFKGLYNLFNNWFLAIASYNVGENRIKNLVMKNYTRDFWELARRKQLPAETVQYIPKFLAAGLIAREPEKYGFTGLDYQPAMVFDTATAKDTVDMKILAKSLKVSYEDIRELNPSYKTQYAPAVNGESSVRVPLGLGEAAKIAISEAVVKNKRFLAQVEESPRTKNSFLRYKVQKGETLEAIAVRFDVSVEEIVKANHVKRSRLRPGKTIKIPSNAVTLKEQRTEGKKKETSGIIPRESILHIVKKGETLTRIAKKHNVKLVALAKLNNMNTDQKVLYGQRIAIPK